MSRASKILLLALGLLLVTGALAFAAPVQQFSFQLQNIKPDGRFTLLFTSRTFDTTGGVPPSPTDSYLRLPAGAKVRKQFLNRRWFCNGRELRDSIQSHLEGSGTPFTQRVANLPAFIKTLKKSKSKRDKKWLANARTCQRARVGTGTAMIDARSAIPVLDQLIPSKFSLFFSKPPKGAVASFTVVGAAVESAPIVKRNPIVAGVHVALSASFYNDPTPDGLYGYRLQLPGNTVNGLPISIAELHVTTTGLTIPKGACVKTGKGGRCVKKQKRTLFWFSAPKCPSSGKIDFLAFYGYTPPQPDITKTVQLACPKFG